MQFLIYSLIGGAIGAGIGYFGQCTSGTCPLTSTWWRGSIYGAAMGLLFYLAAGRGDIAATSHVSKNISKISEKEFNAAVIQAGQPVVVDFYATWCGPCKALAPVLDDLAGQMNGKVKFVSVDIDAASSLADQYQVQGVPTLILFKQGRVVDTKVGFVPAAELSTWLQSHLGTIQTAMQGR